MLGNETKADNQPKAWWTIGGAYSRLAGCQTKEKATAGHRHLPWHQQEPKMELEKGSQGDNSNWSDSKTALLPRPKSKDAPSLKD